MQLAFRWAHRAAYLDTIREVVGNVFVQYCAAAATDNKPIAEMQPVAHKPPVGDNQLTPNTQLIVDKPPVGDKPPIADAPQTRH